MISVRQPIYDEFWRFAAERMLVFYRRALGLAEEGQPWTDDPILQEYKFTNTFRACDRLTQFLIREVQPKSLNNDPQEMIFRSIVFRLFNSIDTFDALDDVCPDVAFEGIVAGGISTATFSPLVANAILNKRLEDGLTVYGNAYMHPSMKKDSGFEKKHHAHVDLLMKMIADDLVDKIENAPSLKAIFDLLIEYPMIGKFIAYQMAIDINYTTAVDFSENDFTASGPGCDRGIDKCFTSVGRYKNEDVIKFMVDRQEYEFERLGYHSSVVTLLGRKMHAIDIQNVFCETDKYCRVKYPELTSDKSKIKSKFTPHGALTDLSHGTCGCGLSFPAKWGLGSLRASFMTSKEGLPSSKLMYENKLLDYDRTWKFEREKPAPLPKVKELTEEEKMQGSLF